MLAHMGQSVLFQTAYLGLGNADLPRDFHLGASLEKAQLLNIALPVRQAGHGLLYADHVQPAVVRLFFIGDLVHNI